MIVLKVVLPFLAGYYLSYVFRAVNAVLGPTLAREFGLFDNLYCTGAISADGHHWLNEAFADDYDERAMSNYPRSYPCCGTDPLA